MLICRYESEKNVENIDKSAVFRGKMQNIVYAKYMMNKTSLDVKCEY